MQDQSNTRKTAESRRGKRDRRIDDAQLIVVKKERRISVERRLPIVDELTVSFGEWVRSMALFQAKIRKRVKVRAAAQTIPRKW